MNILPRSLFRSELYDEIKKFGSKKIGRKNYRLKISLSRQSSGLSKLFPLDFIKKIKIFLNNYLSFLFSLFLPGFIWVNQDEKVRLIF